MDDGVTSAVLHALYEAREIVGDAVPGGALLAEFSAAGRDWSSVPDNALSPIVRSWVRVDAREAKGLDLVGLNHEVAKTLLPELLGGSPDVVLCVDGLQHDPCWGKTVAAAVALVGFGGVLVLVWESPGVRAEPDGTSPAAVAEGFGQGEYRSGLSVAAVLGVVCASAMRVGREVAQLRIVAGEAEPRSSLVVQIVPVPHPPAAT